MKPKDQTMVALNGAGLSLRAIGRRLDLHHTTVAYRLKLLGLVPTDTRKSFMDRVFESLTKDQQAWLLARLSGGTSLHELLKELLVKAYLTRN